MAISGLNHYRQAAMAIQRSYRGYKQRTNPERTMSTTQSWEQRGFQAALAKRGNDLCPICLETIPEATYLTAEKIRELAADPTQLRAYLTASTKPKKIAYFGKCFHIAHTNCVRRNIKSMLERRQAVRCPVCRLPEGQEPVEVQKEAKAVTELAKLHANQAATREGLEARVDGALQEVGQDLNMDQNPPPLFISLAFGVILIVIGLQCSEVKFSSLLEETIAYMVVAYQQLYERIFELFNNQ